MPRTVAADGTDLDLDTTVADAYEAEHYDRLAEREAHRAGTATVYAPSETVMQRDFYTPDFAVEPDRDYHHPPAPGIARHAHDAAHRWQFGRRLVSRTACSHLRELDRFTVVEGDAGRTRVEGLTLAEVNAMLQGD